MNRTTLQIILLLFVFVLCAGGYFLGKHLLNLPFRATNDALHEKDATFTLDFLIPAGTHIDKKMTIGQVLRLRAQKEGSFYEKMIRGLSDMIPTQYRFVGNALLFLFWTLLFMTFLRLFTFMGYGKALRGSLLLGGIIYYFMPDFSPGIFDDILFLCFSASIIVFRTILKRKKKKKGMTS